MARRADNENNSNAADRATSAKAKKAAKPVSEQGKPVRSRRVAAKKPTESATATPSAPNAGKVVITDVQSADAVTKKAAKRPKATAPTAAANKVSPSKSATAKKPRSAAPKSGPTKQPPQSAELPQQPAKVLSAAAAAKAEAKAEAINAANAQKLAENLERIEALSHRLVTAFSARPAPNPGVEGPGSDLYVSAASALMKTLAEQPARIIEQQVNYWAETLKHYTKAQMEVAKGSLRAPEDDSPSDKRFGNPLWRSHPFFNYVKNQYLINADAMHRAAAELELPDDRARRRLNWMINQIVDMMSPTNFLATNPDALEKAVQTEGESLVKGLENLVRDIENSGGEMVVSLADRDAFTVGENIGASEGRVVHRTSLYELIQYQPSTAKVHELPLLIFPPWINKFYILDLKPQNSLIRWLVGQGHTLFVVSWKNPDASYAETGMEDYVNAYLEAMDKVSELTAQKKLNVVGYCIAGTTLSLTLALMAKRNDTRVNSATFFTTLTDFSNHGEFTTFLHDDFIEGIAEEVQRHGMLKASLMSRTMSYLRANDLVWGPAVRSYMLGETPPAFDLLFWNGDSTNLPGKMTMQYLIGLCKANEFAGDGFSLFGHNLKLSDIQTPLCSVACETDHIAPWSDCWRGVAQMGSSDKSFILSESGHVAGIVNPPTKVKYGHYVDGGGFADGSESWHESATFKEGSWWPTWGGWLASRSGKMVDARVPAADLEPAPGYYVHERAI